MGLLVLIVGGSWHVACEKLHDICMHNTHKVSIARKDMVEFKDGTTYRAVPGGSQWDVERLRGLRPERIITVYPEKIHKDVWDEIFRLRAQKLCLSTNDPQN